MVFTKRDFLLGTPKRGKFVDVAARFESRETGIVERRKLFTMANLFYLITVMVMALGELGFVNTQYLPPSGMNYMEQQQQQYQYGTGGGGGVAEPMAIPVRTSGLPLVSTGNELGAGM